MEGQFPHEQAVHPAERELEELDAIALQVRHQRLCRIIAVATEAEEMATAEEE